MLNLSGYPMELALPSGTPLYEHAGDPRPIGVLTRDATLTCLGRLMTPGGWYLVHVSTSSGWPDHVQRDSGLYIFIAGEPHFV